MIRLQGKYRLTFPVTPGEVEFRGYGNEVESTTTIALLTNNRISGRRPKSIAFEFILPGNLESPFIEVEGYQGPRAWLAGLDRLTGAEVLLTIDELNLAWNVLVGPCDGRFSGKNVDFHGSIELPLYVKEEFVTWSNQTQLLSPEKVIAKQQKARPNTSGKKAKKSTGQSLVASDIQAIQRDRIDRKLASLNRAIGT
ncbi:hypothetical protein EDM54_01680 [Brevibacillus borstelensis]|uniref:hypothetical protein n=1 Tax=Brevibacillus borstelensis TaxID=45462 RepID=UPI000F093257|nr:hypothetical protein [Brevibacillus borstelensis]MED1881063.1 hypothetical protein [Brevibacillus borstelensis]RNB66408.1 hypothetical protein EDM54_01680 [Brevibacillus borstelensis]GED53545.1 hypothetical protein BBO01nite_27860 [Brevibacillus borstelensis]